MSMYSRRPIMGSLWAKLFQIRIKNKPMITSSKLPCPLNWATFRKRDLLKLPKLITLSILLIIIFYVIPLSGTQCIFFFSGDRFVGFVRRDVAADGHPLPLQPVERHRRPRLPNVGHAYRHQDQLHEQKNIARLHSRNF